MKVYCFAGPNGSGKSTLFAKIVSENELKVPFINADNIARLDSLAVIKDPNERNLIAAQYAEKMRHDKIEKGEDFSFETVLSTDRNLELLKLAKQKGYEVILFYVTTKNPSINIERVHKRVKEGGHDVPEEKIVSRYYKSMGLLEKVIEVADRAYVYDNSNQYELALCKTEGKTYLINKSPDKNDNILSQYIKKKKNV